MRADPVDLRVPTADWVAATGGPIRGSTFAGMDEGQLEDLCSGLDDETSAVVTSYSIPTEWLTLKLLRAYRCEGGQWVKTDQTTWKSDRSPAPPIAARQRSNRGCSR